MKPAALAGPVLVVGALAAAVSTTAGQAPGPSAPATAARLLVTNTLDTPREQETVELRARAVASAIAPADLPKLVVTDARSGHEVLAQAVDEDGDDAFDALVFQTDFAPGESREFVLSRGALRKPRREDFRVHGRFVRERQDDFAWENDLVAFRVYGPGLEAFAKEPLTSSAVDVWSKRTRRFVIDDWYLVDDYHRDHGEGGDFYPAGTSRGCGGSGLMIDGRLAVARNFRDSVVRANGPIRLVFELTYPLWKDGVRASERKRVTLDAGSHFNRFESVFTREGKGEITWAAGIRKAKGASVRLDREHGFVRTWEIQDRYGDGGWLGCAVVMDPAQIADVTELGGNELVVARSADRQPVVWHAGAGWDRSGEFADVAGWDRHVEAFARRLAAPLRVEVR